MLSIEDEAIIIAFRRHTFLPLDDCLYAPQPTIPHLTRSSLDRFLHRHGIRRLPEVEGAKPQKKKFKTYPIGFFRIDIAEVKTSGSTSMSPIDRTSKFAFVQLVKKTGRTSAAGVLAATPGPLARDHRAVENGLHRAMDRSFAAANRTLIIA